LRRQPIEARAARRQQLLPPRLEEPSRRLDAALIYENIVWMTVTLSAAVRSRRRQPSVGRTTPARERHGRRAVKGR
jgi:hypothetical protein